MKKLFLNFMFAASLLLSAGVSFVSCSDDNEPGRGQDPDNPPLVEGELIKGEDTPTPIKCFEGETEGSDYGVKIIPGVTLDNEIRFECIPGASVKSYRLDVIPLSKAYDIIYTKNYDAINEGKILTVDETAEAIRSQLFSEGGSAGYTFSPESKGFEDYAEGHEFNWAADQYSQFTIVPNAEYLIIAVGCSDDSGANGRDMTVCLVTTSEKELIGDPIVTVNEDNIQKGWSAFGIYMTANADAKYYYLLPIGTKELEKYREFYGDAVFADMVRFTQNPGDATKDQLYAEYGLWLDPSEEISIVTIGADENYVVNDMQVTSFYMEQKPADRVLPDPSMVEITWNQEKTSASVANLDIKIAKEISMVRYKLVTKEEWTAMENDEEAQAALAYELVYNGGWAEMNPNYKLERKDGGFVLTGSEGTAKTWQYILTANTEYELVYTCVNGFEDYSAKLGHCYFKTDAQTRVPDGEYYGTDFVPSVSNTSTGITLEFTPNDNIAFYYHTMVPSNISFDLWNKASEAYDYMFSPETYFNFAYPWDFEKGTAEWSEHNRFTYEGLTPGTTYQILTIAEDWEGNLSDPYIEYASTDPSLGGPNPAMTIENAKYEYRADQGANCFVVDFVPNSDVQIYYCIIGDRNKVDMEESYADEANYWKRYLVEGPEGGDGTAAGMQFYGRVTLPAQITDDTTCDYKIAACYPYGSGENRGDLVMAVFDVKNKTIITDLSTLWPDYVAPASVQSLPATKGVSMQLFLATERIMKNKAEVESFLQSLRDVRGVDMSKYQYTPARKAPAPKLVKE